MTAHPRMLSRSGYSEAEAREVPAGDKAERFRALALPHLDEVYTLARYLLRDVADAEDAVQECYLRALRHFATFRGGAMKPWLLAILRNVCRAEYARRGRISVLHVEEMDEAVDSVSQGLWSEAPSPEAASLARLDAQSAQQLIADLPEQFREVLVLREVNDLSYREIAEVVGVPVGTVMSRLARGRALLRQAFASQEN
jgi:RNA polymerase sigma-70 factor, ECF subfamily